jgi:phage shock protein E
MGLFSALFGHTDNKQLDAALSPDALLVDVRTASEFAQGSVKGAVNIPLDEIPAELSRFKNKKQIVVFCRSGNRSSRAKILLEKSGFRHVINGGTWQNVHRLVSRQK